jgi:hypothetical protein
MSATTLSAAFSAALDVSVALRLERLRPGTDHHLVARQLLHRLGEHAPAWPGRPASHVSISYALPWVVVAIAAPDEAIGVDAEPADRPVGPGARAWIAAWQRIEPDPLTAWTMAEAVAKADPGHRIGDLPLPWHRTATTSVAGLRISLAVCRRPCPRESAGSRRCGR